MQIEREQKDKRECEMMRIIMWPDHAVWRLYRGLYNSTAKCFPTWGTGKDFDLLNLEKTDIMTL